MPIPTSQPSEEDVINNSNLNTLYSHDFERGRFFQVIHEDELGFEFPVSSRVMFKIIYIKENNEVTGFEIIQLKRTSDGMQEKSKIQISSLCFNSLRNFLDLINRIDLNGISERKVRLGSDFFEGEIDDETKLELLGLLSRPEASGVINELFKNGMIERGDIVNVGYRKNQLNVFSAMLSDINTSERQWQEFFMKNEWIFGYGLQYRFQGILQREAHIGETNLNGSGESITDYLLADNYFTTFVELKKSDTPLFATLSNRAGSWRLSNDLIYAESQVLQQKATGQIKLNNEGQFDIEGNRVRQIAVDSKVILIIGRLDSLSNLSDREADLKRKTFELHRRDSRNIEIITYDELYNRALHIVRNSEENINLNGSD